MNGVVWRVWREISSPMISSSSERFTVVRTGLGRDCAHGSGLVAAGIAAVFGSLLWIAGVSGGAVAVVVTVALIWTAWRCSTGEGSRSLR